MKKLLLLSLTMLLPLLVNADAVEINGIYYNLIKKGNIAEVTFIEGKKYTGDIVIPESVKYEDETYIVSTIGEGAFLCCYDLSSVTIPNTVTVLANGAFHECTSLTSISIPNSVETIGSGCFAFCSELVSVTIPNSVTSIGSSAFQSCSSLKSIIIPNSVVSIEGNAFLYCSCLTEITIPNSLKSIEEGTFGNCSGLSSVSIPNSVTFIGQGAFAGCSGLTTLSIPNSVKTIDIAAFERCTGLTSITIGNGVKKVKNFAFAKCPAVTDFYCYAETVPSTSSDCFEGSYPAYIVLHVPENSVDAYKATTPWSGFKEVVAISPSGISKLEASETSVKCEDGQLTVEGINDGQIVDIYSLNGKKLDSAVVKNGTTHIDSKHLSEKAVIVKVNNKSIKLLHK